MSVNKYTPAVLAGIRNSGHHALFPWPDEVPGLGQRAVVSFRRCADCPKDIHVRASGTFVTFGGRAMCLACTRRRTEEAAA